MTYEHTHNSSLTRLSAKASEPDLGPFLLLLLFLLFYAPLLGFLLVLLSPISSSFSFSFFFFFIQARLASKILNVYYLQMYFMFDIIRKRIKREVIYLLQLSMLFDFYFVSYHYHLTKYQGRGKICGPTISPFIFRV